MTRVFENATFFRRLNIYVVILVAVMINGVWELSVYVRDPSNQMALLFGAGFLLGGAYGLWQTFRDGRDLVAAFDTEADGTARVTLWRPFRRIAVEAPLKAVVGWKFWVKAGQAGLRRHLIYATFPNYPRPLEFELKPNDPTPEGLRAIAPRAIADFEENIGRRPADPG